MRSESRGRSWLGLRFAAWLLVLGVPIAASVLWRRAGYPEGEGVLYNAFPLIAALIATIAWGYALGRRGRWTFLLVSDVVGALACVILVEIGSQIEPIGGEGGYYILNWLIYCVAIAIVLGLGAVIGLATRTLAVRRDR